MPALADVTIHVDPCKCDRCDDPHLSVAAHDRSTATGSAQDNN
jgi:hypothetical protein